MILVAVALFGAQVASLVALLNARPTVSEVRFNLSDSGILFPVCPLTHSSLHPNSLPFPEQVVTICNYNAVNDKLKSCEFPSGLPD